MNDETKKEVEEIYTNLIEEINIEDSKRILERSVRYKESLQKKDIPTNISNDLSIVDELATTFPKLKSTTNKRILLAALEYFIDPWDYIPDVDLEKGLVDDIYVLKYAREKLRSMQARKSSAKKLKIKSSTVLDDLGYSLQHMIQLSRELKLYTPTQSMFLRKIANFNRANVDINSKEKVYAALLIQRFFENSKGKISCKSSPCSDCYRINKFYRSNFS